MRLMSLGSGQFVRVDGTDIEKALTPRNLAVAVAVPGLRKIEDLFVERIGKMIARALGPIFATNISEGERELRIDQGLALLMPDIEESAIELITQAYRITMEDEGVSAFAMSDQAAIEHVLSLPDGLVPALSGISEDIRQRMERAIKEAQATPVFSLDRLVENLREIANLTTTRLERISRTETTRIANVARETQWHKIGMDPNERVYHWIRAQDARVCPICEAIFQGNPYTLNDLKRITNGFVVHVNCRCLVVRRPLG